MNITKLKITSCILSILFSCSAVASDKTEPNNEVYKDTYKEQYKSWHKTDENSKTVDLLAEDPRLVILWAGYGFAKDYNGPKGHMYSVTDLRNSLRTGAPTNSEDGPMPMACWSCKSPNVPELIETLGEDNFFKGKWSKGGEEIVSAIGCGDCHEKGSPKLRISRPFAKRVLKEIGVDFATASRTQKQNTVCAQCHAEYYFDKGKVVFPWKNGMTVDAIEKYYDKLNFSDWTHKISKAPLLKAQHPGYETYSASVHAKNDVSCVDCHMPRLTNENGKKYTQHKVGNPFDNYPQTCGRCHNQPKKVMENIIHDKQEKVTFVQLKVEDQLVKAHFEAEAAWKAGATEKQMQAVLLDIRHAQWRWDYAVASHGLAAHDSDEALRILATALDAAANARAGLASILGAKGITKVDIPDITTKAKAQKIIGLDMNKEKANKERFKKEMLPKWDAAYKAKHNK